MKRFLIIALATMCGVFFGHMTADAAPAKKAKQAVVKPAPKKDDGKIKPLDPNRKVPTLKKKYKKD